MNSLVNVTFTARYPLLQLQHQLIALPFTAAPYHTIRADAWQTCMMQAAVSFFLPAELADPMYVALTSLLLLLLLDMTHRHVYVLAASSVGKSCFVRALLKCSLLCLL